VIVAFLFPRAISSASMQPGVQLSFRYSMSCSKITF
jgi:hypothetical protein